MYDEYTVSRDLYIPREDSPLREILEYYVTTVSVTKRSYKTELYRIKALDDILGGLPLKGITPMHVVAFRDQRLATPHPRNPEQTLATSTVKLEMMLLSHVFSTAITEWGMGDLVNPVSKVRKPKAPPGRVRRLTPVEERKVLRSAWRHPNREFYAIIVLALETAMRQGEILSAMWQNVNWTRRTLHLSMTKNGDPRDVPLSRTAFDILTNHMKPQMEGRIFSYTANGLKSTWRFFIACIGIENLHFHDLRHCAISSLLERGLNTIEVAAISGHKSMAMLKRYSHLLSYKLVVKLDPKPRAKKERPILREQLQCYPAILTQRSRRVDVDFVDFVDLRVSGRDVSDACERAQSVLLTRLVKMLCDGVRIPAPGNVDAGGQHKMGARIQMISPL